MQMLEFLKIIILKKVFWELKIQNNHKPDYVKLLNYFLNFNLYSNTSIKKSFAISSGIDSNFILQQSINDKSYNIKKDLSVISEIKNIIMYQNIEKMLIFLINIHLKLIYIQTKKY